MILWALLAGVAALCFLLAAWSRGQSKSGRLTVHFLGWAAVATSFLAIDRWLRLSAPPPHPLAVAWSASFLLVVVCLTIGLIAAGARRMPLALRRLLAPFDGLALWAQWLLGLARIRRARRREERDAAEGVGPATGESALREGVRDLASLTVGEIMIPRSEVVALEGSASVARTIGIARRAPHSVFPVFGDGVDQPLGVVRMIDLSGQANAERPVRELARPVLIVPETMRCLALLPRLAPAVDAAAFVVDEFGGMAGFLTIEDLIEVLVGDFVGEHETERRRILQVSPRSYRVEGSCRVDEFNLAVESVLPEGDYETVAGLFLDRYGRIPAVGDDVSLPGARIEISAATDRRVLWVSIELTRERARSA